MLSIRTQQLREAKILFSNSKKNNYSKIKIKFKIKNKNNINTNKFINIYVYICCIDF